LQTLSVVAEVALPSNPSDIDISADGKTLVIALPLQRAIATIDLAREPLQPVVIPITLAGNSAPRLLRFAMDRKVMANTDSRTAEWLMEIDLDRGTQRFRTDAPLTGPAPALLERSADHSVLVLTGQQCVVRLDARADRFGTCRSGIPARSALSLDASGARVALDLHVFDPAWFPLRAVDSFNRASLGSSTAITPDGREVYYTLDGRIVHLRVDDGEVLDRMNLLLDSFGRYRLRVSPDGSHLLIARLDGGGLFVVSLR
jgi:hypothetical protein